LRAAFLVSRDGQHAFLERMRTFAEARAGLRWEYSGPWPPYSFAAQATEQGTGQDKGQDKEASQ
jgi:hypothetical protein